MEPILKWIVKMIQSNAMNFKGYFEMLKRVLLKYKYRTYKLIKYEGYKSSNFDKIIEDLKHSGETKKQKTMINGLRKDMI